MKSIKVSDISGTYIGQEDNGIIAFKGIPYAKPPTGSLRWKAPQSISQGDNAVVKASKFRSPCIQPIPKLDRSSLGTQSEDCLTLNIWTKELESERKPVMVYIHGGGYVFGGSSEPLYD